MKIYNKITPEGTRDLLFEQCEARRSIKSRLYAYFCGRGFEEVMTPALEFYDVFYSNSTYFPQESMYKLTDNKGRLLVMRPDCTIPIARLTATKLAALPTPIRLFYEQSIYRTNPTMKGSSDECCQMGVELIGSGSKKADLEVLQLAAACFEQCGIAHFRLEICHIGFFKKLMQELDASPAQKEQLRALIESKNYAGLTDRLECFAPSKAAEVLGKLPRLFGAQDVLWQAAALFDGAEMDAIIADMAFFYTCLKQMGLEGKVLVDLGLVNQAEYYTGMIFRGYVEGIGEPVLSGGRYDSLMQDFGQDRPATGFAVNVDLMAKALLAHQSPTKHPAQILVHGEKQYSAEVYAQIAQLMAQGKVCENSLFDSLEQAKAHAKAKGIPTIRLVGQTTTDIAVE